jgi:hypothetical protein
MHYACLKRNGCAVQVQVYVHAHIQHQPVPKPSTFCSVENLDIILRNHPVTAELIMSSLTALLLLLLSLATKSAAVCQSDNKSNEGA